MERYTIEDVEILRKKSGISYEEAVNLLEYHNGNLARALVDLERNGRINPKAEAQTYQANINGKKVNAFFSKLFRFRILVKKGDVTIVNLSVLFMTLTTLISPHLLFLSLLLILVLGYRISFEKNSASFAGDNFESIIKNAANNVKETVTGFANEFDSEFKSKKEQRHNKSADENKSYYQNDGNPMTPPAPQPPTRPVTVEYENEMKIELDQDDNGFSEATIE